MIELVADGNTYGIIVAEGTFFFLNDAYGYRVGAVGQTVLVNGSPLVLSFDPPIAPSVSAGEIYTRIQGGL